MENDYRLPPDRTVTIATEVESNEHGIVRVATKAGNHTASLGFWPVLRDSEGEFIVIMGEAPLEVRLTTPRGGR